MVTLAGILSGMSRVRMVRGTLAAALAAAAPVPGAAQKVTIVPLPVIGANPTTGFSAGVSPGFYWNAGDPATTTMSSAVGAAVYTANKQLFLNLRGTAFLPGDRWLAVADVRFALNAQPTYGLGTAPEYSDNTLVGGDSEVSDNPYDRVPRQEMLGFNNLRVHGTLYRRVADTRLFLGAGYHLDHVWNIDDRQLDLDAEPPAISWHEQYQQSIGVSSERYTQSGLSANVLYDSRDNPANPYKGRYALAAWRLSPTFLGSTVTQSQLWLEGRAYVNLDRDVPRHLLAFWGWGWFQTGGEMPYLFLPATGWDMFSRSGRPYTQGRHRGQDVLYAEAEWRFPLPIRPASARWGGVVFLNGRTASNREFEEGLFDTVRLGVGAGLRYMLKPANRVNVAIDYGFGAHGAQGLFVGLQEAF